MSNRRGLEALIRSGAFDEFDPNRAGHVAELATALRVAEQHGKMAQTGQNDLFGLAVNEDVADSETYTTEVEPWSDNERLAAEKLTLGLYLTGHPIDQYEPELKHFTHGKIASLQLSRGNMEARVAGQVIEVRTRQTKQGKTMGFATLDDKSGRLECAVFGEIYEKYRGVFTRDNLVIAEGSLAIDSFSGALRLNVEKLYDMEQARESFARGIKITLNVQEDKPGFLNYIDRLGEVLNPYKRGSCPVTIKYCSKIARATVQLGDEWRVHPSDELLSRLKSLFGSKCVELRYK